MGDNFVTRTEFYSALAVLCAAAIAWAWTMPRSSDVTELKESAIETARDVKGIREELVAQGHLQPRND